MGSHLTEAYYRTIEPMKTLKITPKRGRYEKLTENEA